jgi:hypothetical protein
VEKSKYKFYTHSEYRAVYEKMRKSMVQADRLQMATEHGSKMIRFALRASKARKQRETLVIFSAYWFVQRQ